MKPLFTNLLNAFWYDELAFRRWLRGGMFALAPIVAQLMNDPLWTTWTAKQWTVKVIPSLVLFAAGAMQSSAKKVE
jgi:hypothetical protein